MVHQIQTDRSPRKRDRRTAGLPPYAPPRDSSEFAFVGTAGSGPPLGEIQPPLPKAPRLGMYDTYQPWVLQTYGDQAKTKTITRNKYQRILQILRGDFIDNETSKFKLWVKGRGFRIGPPPGYYHPSLMDTNIGHSAIDYNPDKDPCPDIYVQTGTIKDTEGNDRICFKKVAIVEDFFEIVYNLHVCRDGKEQKHMGQKRTYRAVSERYAFVPREAVTKFLVLCTECPRRSTGVPVSLSNLNKSKSKASKNSTPSHLMPSAINTSLGALNNSLGTTLLGSPLLGVTLASSHGGAMVLSSTPTKTKNNFSSVVSLVGDNNETSNNQHSATIHMGRNGAITFNGMNGLHDQKLSFSPITMTQLPQTPLLHPIPTTPPPKKTPKEPPRVIKTEPRSLITPETSLESSMQLPAEESNMQYDFEDEPKDYGAKLSALSTQMDYSLPITTLYMKHIRNKKLNFYEHNNNIWKDGPTVMAESEGSDEEMKNVTSEKRNDQNSSNQWASFQQQEQQQPLSLSKADAQRRSPCASPGTVERTDTPMEAMNNAEETSSNGNKDDEEDDNDDDNDDEKIDAQYDPERLKAFNMFVRLFVDENLDRIVPISKQPKEKIQAIIDACARQFPEFADRTRKRLRTYLKSCRRNKRARDTNGWENSRPTPPHLTSIQAEQILATACENEAQNAKRMRLGLEPVSQPNPLVPQAISTPSQLNSDKPLTIVESSSVTKMDSSSSGVSSSATHSTSALAKALERPLSETKGVNGSSIFPSSFHNNYQKVSGSGGHVQQGVSMLLSSGVAASSSSQVVGSISTGTPCSSTAVNMVANGPTDLSLKGTAAKSTPRPSLNPVEVAAVRQLITGYRESAAFLLRSADELENLLVHQHNP